MKRSCLTVLLTILLAAFPEFAAAAQERSAKPTHSPVAVQASASARVLSGARMQWSASSPERPTISGENGGSSTSEVTTTLRRESGQDEKGRVHYVDFH
jgi:hypothetical protein